jgi:nitric oxide dioxygenase
MITYDFHIIGGWYGFKQLVVTDRVKESDDIVSFKFQAADGNPLPKFKPGQYLSIRIPKDKMPGAENDMVRNYSLSSGPDMDFYRISIKKEMSNDSVHPDGQVSSYFHDAIDVGSKLEVGMPCGSFVLKSNARPVVLIAGGVGLTPMISILESLVASNTSKKVVFIQCTKNSSTHAMKNLVDNMSDVKSGHGNILKSHVFYSSKTVDKNIKPLVNSKINYGRLTAPILSNLIPMPTGGNEYYFCGPPVFLGSIRKILGELSIPKDQINYEYFGPTEQ